MQMEYSQAYRASCCSRTLFFLDKLGRIVCLEKDKGAMVHAHDVATPLPKSSPEPSSSMPPSLGGQTVQLGDERISMSHALAIGSKLRVACEQCRTRKLRCSGVSGDGSACTRCAMDGADCYFGTFPA